MLAGFGILLILIVSSVVDVFVGHADSPGWRLLVTGLGIILVSYDLDAGERKLLRKTLYPLVPAIAVLAAWIAFQVSSATLGINPVWDSARAALGAALTGHPSVDVGASVLSLSSLSLFGATVVLSACVALDRVRAEGVLIAMTLSALALVVIGEMVHGAEVGAAASRRSVTLDCAAIGAVLSFACAVLTFERYETRYRRRRYGLAMLTVAAGLCISVSLYCGFAVLKEGDLGLNVALGAGLISMLVLVVIRRSSYGLWIGGAIGGMFGLTVLALLMSSRLGYDEAGRAVDPAPLLDAQSRMAADAPWVGIGAGSYPAMVPLYGSLSYPAGPLAQSAAGILRIELGTPMFWVATVVAGLLGLKLMVGALKRGRDSIYALVGSAIVLVVLALGFANIGVTDPAVVMLGSAMLGLALVQSESRSTL